MGEKTDKAKQAIERHKKAKVTTPARPPDPPQRSARDLAVAVLKRDKVAGDDELRQLAALAIRDLDAKPKAKKRKPRVKPDRSPEGRDKAAAAKGRLPRGSRVNAIWNGQEWTAELFIDNADTGDVDGLFLGKGDGLFKLLSQLDDQFRASVKSQRVPNGPEPG